MLEQMTLLSPKAKLARSRAELLAAMGYEQAQDELGHSQNIIQLPTAEKRTLSDSVAAKVGQSVVGRWWRRHPLSAVVELGEPFLQDYASRHPAKLIAYGAGTGALLWVLKPWRLLSVATVVALLLKSSDITGLVSDVVRKRKPEAAAQGEEAQG